jgi:tRNA dimethylallyltransferase
MLEDGFREEVRGLLAEPQPLSPQARSAIGYAEMIDCFEGKRTWEQTVEQIKINTRRLAKAQRTWFKTFAGVRWIEIGPDEDLPQVLERCLHLLE